jgi:hypothetical protein
MRLIRRIFFSAALIAAWHCAFAQQPKELVGRYQMEVQDGDVLELRADGSASLAGDAMRWSAKAGVLTLGQDVLPYRLQDGRLWLSMGSVQLAWKRLGSSAAATPMERAAARAQGGTAMAQGAAGGSREDEEARRLLMSSAWCSFTYNQRSGASSTKRVVFRGDGVLAVGSGGETYSSGYGGTYAGQSSGNQSMRWQLRNQRLYVDDGEGGGFQDVGLSAQRNSSGYIILRADGREYSQCN